MSFARDHSTESPSGHILDQPDFVFIGLYRVQNAIDRVFKTSDHLGIAVSEFCVFRRLDKCLELAYVLKGEILHNVGGMTYKIHEGEFFIVDYDQFHSYLVVSGKDFRLINVMFCPRLFGLGAERKKRTT